MSKQKIYFINISSFDTIMETDFFEINNSYFFYIKGENEIGLKYINKSLDEHSFKLNINMKKINDNKNLIKKYLNMYVYSILMKMCLKNKLF